MLRNPKLTFTIEQWNLIDSLILENKNYAEINKIIPITDSIVTRRRKKLGYVFILPKKEIRICPTCSKETFNPRFCSRSCAAITTNKEVPKKRTKKRCNVCGDHVIDHRYSKCLIHWNEYKLNKADSYKNRTLKEYFDRDSLKDLHPSSKSAHIRGLAGTWFKHLKKEPCANCGYSKHVELCHIKGIKEFDETALVGEVNSPDNIIQLCPNCHWELDKGDLTIEEIKNKKGVL